MSTRHDWYQSDSSVVINILLKNANDKNCNIVIRNKLVYVTADGYELELILYRPIDESRSSYKITPLKIEITLAKQSAERWPILTKDEKNVGVKQLASRDWDKLAVEINKTETEEAKGEEALQNLFNKIYSDSSEEVKRAMNKSFSESGGTVLSTSWDEVGKKKVDVKPPDGTEFKKWKN